jgi:TonB-dependent receptor
MDVHSVRLWRRVWAVVLAFACSGAALAQESLEEVVVTGIRASLTEALDIKRESVQIVDAIVAEDIGKFPDNNVVEALQRVSGIQVTDRQSGEIAVVSIRGLTDVTTTINARNIFTASGRSVALADIPASLLKRVDVYKTRSADLLETGIAGQIDIQTQRPFDFTGSKVVLSARGIYQEQADKLDPNLSALFSDRWDTSRGQVGALLNISYAETHYRDQSVTAGALLPFVTDNPPAGFAPYERIFPTDDRVTEDPIWQAGLLSGLPFAAGSTLLINGQPTEYLLSRDAIFSSDFTGKRERPAVNLALQWAPTDRSEYLFETFYNGYRNESFNSLLFSFVDWWGNLSADPAADIALYPGTNIIKSRNNVGAPYGFTSGDLTTSRTDSTVYALGGNWELSDRFKLKSEAVYQTSEFETDFLALRTERVANGINVDFNSRNGLPAFNFTDNPATATVDESDLTDPNQWAMAQLYDNANSRDGDAATFTLDGDYAADWGIVRSVSMGLRYDDRKATEGQRVQDAPACNTGAAACRLTSYPGLLHVNHGFFDNRSAVPTSWVVADGSYIKDHADEIRTLYRDQVDPALLVGDELQLIESFNVKEKTSTAYLQADFATEIASRKLDGQFGVRYVSVDTDMDFTDVNTLAQSSAAASTSKALPSLMLRYAILDNLRVRVAYGETLRRPDFSQLNPNITYVPDSTDIGYGTASGGNPNLRPTESKNYDLGAEWYFAPSSGVFVTLFKREIEGFIVDFRRRVIFEDYPYILDQPDNSSNGELKGVELGTVYFPENLPRLLDGIGVQASFTWLDSSQDVPVTSSVGDVVGTQTGPLFGVSEKSYSVVLAYEKPKFGARLTYEWRDDFLNNYEAALFANPLGIYRAPEKSMDFQLNYKVSENFRMTLDATNITDEIFQSYYQYPTTDNFGSAIYSRTVALGVRYSF